MAVKDNLLIWQQNVNKSPTCQHDLLSGNKLTKENIDILALQEPAINFNNLSIAAKDWTTIYPTTHGSSPGNTRSLILIRSQISTDSWTQLDFPSGDVTVIQITGAWGKLTLFNIYNDGKHNNTIRLLTKYHKDNQANIGFNTSGNAHTVWVGDFNRHHPYWDDPGDDRLFTREATIAAELLIEAVAEIGLKLALPRGLPTHHHSATKRWSRLDQVFISEHSVSMVTACNTLPDHRGINTDHLPILTELNLATDILEVNPIPNFREVDWDEFQKALSVHLEAVEREVAITTQRQLDERCAKLTEAIQAAIRDQVPITEITPKSKRWWTKELTQLRRKANKLGRQSYKRRSDPGHRIHADHKEAVKHYDRTILFNKNQHWRDWLERAEEPDIWTANRCISATASDGGKARIPLLKYKVGEEDRVARTNEEKGVTLTKGFFPPKPTKLDLVDKEEYPTQCQGNIKITVEQIQGQMRKLKPFKAPGPDGIPNIVLTKCADLLAGSLLCVYEAFLDHRLSYKPWKTFTTVVLRKPGKPRYDVPKAYRPIALLNTMWKVLTAIIADQLTFVTEKHRLLPDNHFGGRPGRTTTDAMHLIAETIKSLWRAGKVTAVLFLDIGAFPNAVPSRLEHNLLKRGVPRKIVTFVHNMLQDRVTTLKFDRYMSDPIQVDNGIGQGDPLSMILYQFYNADLLDIPKRKEESATAFVDDATMIATADTFPKAHEMLVNMMTRPGGIVEWSTIHNSPLEYSKLALVDFAHSCSPKERVPLQLLQKEITPSASAKYLGVIFDQNLNWKAQQAYAVGKGTAWTSQIKRLTRTTWGLTPGGARKLYISVAIPRILYAIDVWCPLPCSTAVRLRGAAKIVKQLTTVQTVGALAVTGGLRTLASDALNAEAFLLPMPHLIDKWRHRATVRLAMLPPEHALFKAVNRKLAGVVKRHRSPINTLLATYGCDSRKIEKLPAISRDPTLRGMLPFEISIADSREDSIRETEHAEEEIQIFTDGSALNGKVGVAAILLRTGNSPQVLHIHLGPESEHTVHEAELAGMLLGMHLISTEKQGNTTFAIGVDNQAAIRAFNSSMRRPGHHLAREIVRMANMLSKQKNRNAFKLTIRWTAGHEGLKGNEMADKEAKRAAEGLTTDKPLLPPYLCKPLLINPAAIKRAHNDMLMSKWAKTWRETDRGQRYMHLEKSTPSKKLLKSSSQPELSRVDASRIAQFRLGHAPTNQYLKRIGRVDSARCPACGEDVETAEHFLLRCGNYAHAHKRWALAQHASKLRKLMTMQTLLGHPEMAIALAKYIKATSRFKDTLPTA